MHPSTLFPALLLLVTLAVSAQDAIKCTDKNDDGVAFESARPGTAEDAGKIVCIYADGTVCIYFPADGSFIGGSSTCPAGIAQDPSVTTLPPTQPTADSTRQKAADDKKAADDRAKAAADREKAAAEKEKSDAAAERQKQAAEEQKQKDEAAEKEKAEMEMEKEKEKEMPMKDMPMDHEKDMPMDDEKDMPMDHEKDMPMESEKPMHMPTEDAPKDWSSEQWGCIKNQCQQYLHITK